MVPRVEKGAKLFREFASTTGRATGVIEDQSLFACDDGRRVPLNQCTYEFLTDELYASARPKT